jgi:hypothetical protein
VRVDSIAVRLRSRSNMEAADLGTRLCQAAARSIYPSYLSVAIPVFALFLATYEVSYWVATFGIWMVKPWVDRTILFALSRAAFGQPTTPADLWRSQRDVWWRQLLSTFTMRRLSPWRSLTQPVYQLEGLRGAALRKRVVQIRRGQTGSGMLLTTVYNLVELVLMVSVTSLLVWFAPKGYEPNINALFTTGNAHSTGLVIAASYAVVVLFLEPFYVASGFALYLNRRAELEAWDIEQEFRRAFSQ